MVRVLVVDDDPDVRQLVAEMVEMLGHEPIVARDGREALAVLERDGPRVVITDWKMPHVDGLELVRTIRAAPRVRYTYVIMLTAFGGSQSYLEGMAAGADDFVTKPVSPDELHARLRVAGRILSLQDDVRLLEGLIRICMYCKKVHVTETGGAGAADHEDTGASAACTGGDWTTIERYVEERSDASFSHDICPACYDTRVKPDLDRLVADPGTIERRIAGPDAPPRA
ncbi:MAG: response regulator [Candidatus Rokubacteria bacterium]|nr:response regulator [Candidatus Rokubacteria bacterium]